MTLGAGSGNFVVGETVTQTVASGKTVSGNGIIIQYQVQQYQHLKLIILLSVTQTHQNQQIQCLYFHQIQQAVI